MKNKIVFDYKENSELASVVDRHVSKLGQLRNYGIKKIEEFEAVIDDRLHVKYLIFLYRDYLELLDACVILLSNSVNQPTLILARSIFERYLYIEYILKENTQHRIMHYQVDKYIRVAESEKSDNQILDDLIGKSKEKPLIEVLDDFKKHVDYSVYFKEYYDYKKQKTHKQSRKSKREANIKWYEVNSGIKNVFELSRNLGREEYYKLMYSRWSMEVHSTNAYGNFLAIDANEVCIKPLRIPQGTIDIVVAISSFTKRVYSYYSKYLLKEEQHNKIVKEINQISNIDESILLEIDRFHNLVSKSVDDHVNKYCR